MAPTKVEVFAVVVYLAMAIIAAYFLFRPPRQEMPSGLHTGTAIPVQQEQQKIKNPEKFRISIPSNMQNAGTTTEIATKKPL